MRKFNLFLAFKLVIFFSFISMAQTHWILQRVIGLPDNPDPQLIFSAVNKDVCWGCNHFGIEAIRTVDGGKNWRVSKIPSDSGLICSCIAAIDSKIAWVVMMDPNRHVSGGIFKTSNGGLTWERDANIYNDLESFPTHIYFFDSNDGVCIGGPSRGSFEIYTTSNGGTDWTRRSQIPQPVLVGEIPNFVGQIYGSGNYLWFGTFNESLYRTSDRGMTWDVTRNVLGPRYGFAVAFRDSLNGLACHFQEGDTLSRSTDGGITWTGIEIHPGLAGLTPYAIVYQKGTSSTYFITSSYNKKVPSEPTNPGSAYSPDDGTTWIKIDTLPKGQMSFAPDGTGWAGGVNDSIYMWPGFSYGDIVVEGSYIDRTFAQKNADSILFRTRFVNNYNRQFSSNLIFSNLGNTMTDSVILYDDGLHGDSLASDGLFGAYIPPLSIEDYFLLNVSTTEDSTNKYINTPIDQYKFTTAGPIKIDSLFVTNESSTSYEVKPYFRNEGLSYTVQNLWIKISTGDNSITEITADSISIASIAPGTIVGPTDDIDITVNSNFSGVFNLNFEIMSDGWTYWRDSISQVITGVDDNKQVPLSYNLSQNYPNPFNPTTNIQFTVTKTTNLKINVYTILGEKVLTVVEGKYTAGSYKVEINASGLPSGIYLYRIESDAFTSAKKMIYLK